MSKETTEALRFIMAFYEPGQTYLDTNAWKQAEAQARAALAEAEAQPKSTTPEREMLADLVAVLCDPEGKASIRGSDGDLAIIDAALTGLRMALDDCEPYMKEGETLSQRIEREQRDTGTALKLLAREKQKTERMSELLHRMLEAPMTHIRDSWKAEARYALVRSDCLADAPERCPHCDGTGDVHSADGEWHGVCCCPAGKALASGKPEECTTCGALVVGVVRQAEAPTVAQPVPDVVEHYGGVFADHEFPQPAPTVAQPVQEPPHKPIGYVLHDAPTNRVVWSNGSVPPDGTILYAAPPQPAPLTDEHILAIDCMSDKTWALLFARAIERAHGIGGKS